MRGGAARSNLLPLEERRHVVAEALHAGTLRRGFGFSPFLTILPLLRRLRLLRLFRTRRFAFHRFGRRFAALRIALHVALLLSGELLAVFFLELLRAEAATACVERIAEGRFRHALDPGFFDWFARQLFDRL